MNLGKCFDFFVSSKSEYAIYVSTDQNHKSFNVIRLNLATFLFDNYLILEKIKRVTLDHQDRLFFTIEKVINLCARFMYVCSEKMRLYDHNKIFKYFTYDLLEYQQPIINFFHYKNCYVEINIPSKTVPIGEVRAELRSENLD